MVMVSLHPFAFRKIVLLVAALIWLTSAVVFADPVFMNAQVTRLARYSNRSESLAPAAAFNPEMTSQAPVSVARNVEQSEVAPPAEPPPFSLSLDRFDTWKIAASSGHELTFWSISLRH